MGIAPVSLLAALFYEVAVFRENPDRRVRNMNTARASLRDLIGLLLVVPVAPGCGGVTGPATLSRSERAAVESVRLDLRLGVQGRRWVQRTEKGRIVYGDEDERQRQLHRDHAGAEVVS